MKKILQLLLLVITSTCALTLPAQAQWMRSKRAVEREQATKGKAESAYKELFKGTHVQRAAGDLMTLHSVDRKVLIEMPLDKLNTDMLVAATVSSVSTPQLGITGFRNMYPMHIHFVRKGKQVVMEVVNRLFLFDKEKMPHLSEAERTNFGNISLMKFEIAGYSPDSTAIVFDASDLFLNDNRWFPVTQATVGSFRASHNIKPTLSRVAALKSFSDNASVKVERTYSVTLTGSSGKVALSNYPATFGVTFSFLKLSEQPMVPRLSDTRVGVFQNSRVVIDTLSHRIAETTFVNRWRIEPADTTAYLAGQLTPPTKPIVFYIDTAFPEEWKEPIRRGVLRWNKSFERIGFKDVVRVRDFPNDDPEFDPDNLKYNCLRYIPVDIENAMGPSWTDPRSGEIINASVFVYSNVTSLNHAWRFVQTAQLDPAVRSRKLPQEVLDRTLEYVIAHEIGHCLGFMHNMAASASIPTDSLRSPSFTAKYGTTASIMDYARFNYVAQREDKGVSLDPPFLGIYDHFMVEWTYRPFIEHKGDYLKEAQELQKLVAKHEGDPRYRHGVQQLELRLDPSAIEEDLGDDPIKAADYGFRNLEYIIANLDEWIQDDPTSEHKAELYGHILDQAVRYCMAVYMNVSGVYLYQTSESSGLPRYKVVPREQQIASAQWLLRKALDFEKLGNAALEAKLPYAADRPFKLYQGFVRNMALLGGSKLALSYYLDNKSYAPSEFIDDLYAFVFAKTIAGNEDLSHAERELQKGFVENIGRTVTEQSKSARAYALTQVTELEQQISRMLAASKYSCCGAHRFGAAHHHHDVEQGDSVYKQLASTSIGFGTGYGNPSDLFMFTVEGVTSYMLSKSFDAKVLLEQAVGRTRDPELKLHYRFLLDRLKRSAK